MRRGGVGVVVFALLALPASAQAVTTPISQIQGTTNTSPFAGQSVDTRGIVTGRKANGFFIETPDATQDADPSTSEGIFVFTSSAPPVAAAVGNDVTVTGTVTEFVPAADPFSRSLTEITSPTVGLLSSGNPLPSPVTLTSASLDPAGGIDQLEPFEGMRVSVASVTVTAPTRGIRDESSATETGNGLFYGVITGGARPYREPGIEAPDTAPPPGAIPPIPRWDANPEVIGVDSDGLTGGTAIDVDAGAAVTNIVGPLDFAFRAYTVLQDPPPSSQPTVTGEATASPVPAPEPGEVLVASFNLSRLFDDTDDPTVGEPVLTTSAFNQRLGKLSGAIRGLMRSPDIIGVQEVESLTTLQALATRINSDATGLGQPDPAYQAYLVEGNDPAGLDVGLLVRGSVSVDLVTQEGKNTLLPNPDSSSAPLWDRPPLVLDATVSRPGHEPLALQVAATDVRVLTGISSVAAGSNGWATDGERVRVKRQRQAEFLANLVEARQDAENVIVLGSFNAFEFNDGMVDVLGTVEGQPAPDNETAVSGDGTDLVNPDLVNLVDELPAADRYSIATTFRGSAAALDHVLVDASVHPLISDFAFARGNADFGTAPFNDGAAPERSADRDMPVAYIQLLQPGTFRFSSSGYSSAESGDATITVERTGGSDGAASVAYATTSGGTATSGADYTAVSGTLDFTDGETTKTFAVPVAPDTFDEPDETVALELTGAVSDPSTATLTILDDDEPAGPLLDVTGPVIRFLNRSLTMNRKGRVPVRLSCKEDDPKGCPGRLKLKRRSTTLGSAAFSILPGETETVVVRLSRKNRRLVNRLRKVRVVGTATATDTSGNVGTAKRTMTLRRRR